MVDIASLKIKVDTSEAKKASNDLKDLSTTGKQAESSSKSLGASYAAMATQIAGAAVVLTGTLAAMKKSIDAATQYQNALNGLASIARYAGQDVGKTMNDALMLTSDGMLSATEAATALKNLLSRGFSTDEAVMMITRFKDAAAFGRQSSLEFGDAVVSATEGIKNENSMLVDNAGVTKNVAKMWDEYAKQIGKTTNDLTMAEKRTAEYNGILKETEGQLGNAEIASAGLEGSNARLSKSFNDMAVTIGQSLTPAAVSLTDMLSNGFTSLNENVIKPFLFYFENVGIRIGETTQKARVFWEVMTNPSQWGTGKLTEQFKMLEQISEDMRQAAYERLNGAPTPVMGKDTGVRRTESNTVTQTETELKKLKSLREKAAKDANAAEVKRLNVAIWVNEQIAASEKKKNDEIAAMTEKRIDLEQMRANENFAEAQRIAAETTSKQQSEFEDLRNAIDGYSKDMAASLADFMTGTKTNFTDMINSMLRDLLRLTLQRTLFDPITSSLSNALSGGGGDLLGSIGSAFSNIFNGGVSSSAGAYSIDANPYLNFGGFRAMGGSVSSGSSYIVGERGPELFTPSSSGSITPNHQLGGNVSVVINNNSQSQATATETTDARGNRKIEVTIGDMVAGEIKRAGSSAYQAINGTFATRPRLVGR